MKKIFLPLIALLLLSSGSALAQSHRPRLIVNIVVSQMRYDWLARYETNFSQEGFMRFMYHGTNCASAYYNYMQTLGPVSLATLTTGVNPSLHGVISTRWIDHTTGHAVSLIEDGSVIGLDSDPGAGRYSARHITMPTLGDKLLAESPGSKVFTIAADPVSAVVMGGQTKQVFWMDEARATWVSSTAYMYRLPDWVSAYNETRPSNNYIYAGWELSKMDRLYVDQSNTIFTNGKSERIESFRREGANDYAAFLHSPYGNTLVADFAKQAVVSQQLGADEHPDVLNVCFDASRYVGQTYGAGSMEVEDMIYRLDRDIADLIKSVTSQVNLANVLFVLTSDHGVSDAWDGDYPPRDRFNPSQFKAILNSFLGIQFGTGDWVVDYIDRQVYLNRDLIYRQNLSLEEVQNRAASFALQFRGISHVLTSTAMQNGYFGASYGHLMQNGFYPRRAGDLMLNFMPGWIEERPGARSLPGSMYDYDTHVPLMMFGWRIPPYRVDEPVDMVRVAPTLALILRIGRPTASDGLTIPGLDYLTK